MTRRSLTTGDRNLYLISTLTSAPWVRTSLTTSEYTHPVFLGVVVESVVLNFFAKCTYHIPDWGLTCCDSDSYNLGVWVKIELGSESDMTALSLSVRFCC